MKSKKKMIPDAYFDDQEFLLGKIDDDLVIGIIGKKPSLDQYIKYLFCTFITQHIDQKQLSLTDVEQITDINVSDISRIKNNHIDRFTIDRLVQIYCKLDSNKGLGQVLRLISDRISSIPA